MRTSSSSSARKRKRKDLSPLEPIERQLPPLDNSSGLSLVLHDARDERVDHAVFHRAPVYQRCLWPEAAADCGKRRAFTGPEVRPSDRRVLANETRPRDVGNGDGNARKRGEWREGIVQTRQENRADRSKKCLATMVVFLGLLCGHWCSGGAEALAGSQKYSTRTVRTRYGTLRGVEDRSSSSVETYYGVPYATPPVGALRYMPPVTPTPWRGTKLADTMPPACPQKPPEPDSSLPRPKRAYLERLAPFLANQSEDCLYLNLYVPKPPHGESFTFLSLRFISIHRSLYDSACNIARGNVSKI